MPLKIDLSHFFADSVLGIDIRDDLCLHLAHGLVMLEEALDAIECFHAFFLLFQVLPVG